MDDLITTAMQNQSYVDQLKTTLGSLMDAAKNGTNSIGEVEEFPALAAFTEFLILSGQQFRDQWVLPSNVSSIIISNDSVAVFKSNYGAFPYDIERK